MSRIIAASLLILASLATAQAQEPFAKSRISSIGLFKNGLAYVERTIEIPNSGTWLLEDLPVPVHGTFWVESDAVVRVRMTRRTVEVPAAAATRLDFQSGLAGENVIVHFSSSQIPAVRGIVLDAGQPADRQWDRGYEQIRYGWNGRHVIADHSEPMLVLDTDQGRAYIKRSMIAYLQVVGAKEKVRVERPAMLLTIDQVPAPGSKVLVRYLAKGIAWAPSYHVDLANPKRLVLRQKAVIKNELEPLQEAEIRLISGFPSMTFAHVTSPLSLNTSWSEFFQQLNQQVSSQHQSISNVVSQQAIVFNAAPQDDGGFDISAIPEGEGVDLHFHSIGKQTLSEGDSLLLETASGECEYEKIVEWTIPDTREGNGRYVPEHRRQNEPERFQDETWDAVRFKNPLSFPMTTAPATIVSGDRFSGQQMSYWVNTGERTTLHITKALSVRTRSTERELDGNREIVYVGGNDFRKTQVEGTIQANNHRNEPVTLVIRRRFSGELLSAEGKPQKTLLPEGVWSVNKRNQLIWTVTLEPGQEISLRYRYELLVDH